MLKTLELVKNVITSATNDLMYVFVAELKRTTKKGWLTGHTVTLFHKVHFQQTKCYDVSSVEGSDKVHVPYFVFVRK